MSSPWDSNWRDAIDQLLIQDGLNIFSTELKKADAIRLKGKKKGKLNASDRDNLRKIYSKLYDVVRLSHVDVFEENVPKREVTSWLNHAATVFHEIAKDPHWIRTGTLIRHDEMVFGTCLYLFNHPLAVVKVFKDNAFFAGISALILARKETFLGLPFALSIELIVNQILACSTNIFEWPVEKTFKKLESSGILEHYLLCVAVKQPSDETRSCKEQALHDLQTCVPLIKKRFKQGTPCGDSLRAILDGRMVVCPRALPFLQNMLKISDTLAETAVFEPRTCLVCAYCQMTDIEGKFMQCAKCRRTSYCSKECQRADWKRHKPECSPESKGALKISDANYNLCGDYVKKYYVEIMVKLVEESEKADGLTIMDMIVELDFTADDNGNIPVFQEPPEIKVFSTFNDPKALSDRGITEELLQNSADGGPFYGLLCQPIFDDRSGATFCFRW